MNFSPVGNPCRHGQCARAWVLLTTMAPLVAAGMAGVRALAADTPAPSPDKAPPATRPAASTQPAEEGFIPLFDGKSLDGWKASENPDAFKVVDGMICCNGERAHLFYVGPVQDHDFRNFHLKAEVMTWPNSNSGIYFHTTSQGPGWPSKGFEVQVNNSYQSDPRKTGSLYAVKDVKQAPAKDNEWFLYEIIVQGKTVTLKVDGKTVNEYTVPADFQPPKSMEGRVLGHGTFALQAHDKGSKVCFRNIQVKPLPQ